MTKGELRARLAAARDALAAGEVAERSARILARVLEVPEVGAAGSVFAYVSSGNEVDTPGLIRSRCRLCGPLAGDPSRRGFRSGVSGDREAVRAGGVGVPARKAPGKGRRSSLLDKALAEAVK